MVVFCWSYVLRTFGLFLRYPSAIPNAFLGFSRMADHVAKKISEEYSNPVKVKHTYGFDIYLNPVDKSGTSAHIGTVGWYEPATTELFRKLLKEGMIVIDIGANIGWFSLLAAKIVGERGIVLSFEPEPTNFSLLSRSLEQNKFNNVRLFKECVSDIDGVQTLYLSTEPGAHSIIRQVGAKKIIVPSVKLDTVLSRFNIDKINLLKIDAEGAEPEVLEGARGLLSDLKIENIIVEWNPESWSKRKSLLANLFSNYEFYKIVRTSPFLIKKVDFDSVSKLPPASNLYLRRR